MPHSASQINLGFVGRKKKKKKKEKRERENKKLNYANESDIRHCSVLSSRS